MLDPDRSDPAATRQSRRRRAVLKHAFEHGLRPARHSELAGEDHDRRRRSVHADRLDAGTSGVHWFEIGVAISTGRARREPEPNANTGATISARNITGRTRSITCGESVILF